jgi:hypothetical protein
MTALVIAVLTSSLLGSAHCAGMCGAFLAVAINGAEATTAREKARLQLAYHAGRLATYVALGCVAGALGSAVDIAARSAGLTRGAAVLAGVMMVLTGGLALASHLGVHTAGFMPRAWAPAFMQRWLLAGHRRVGDWQAGSRALAIGLLTTLLPCGWLYVFLVVAAGTGVWWHGGVVMAVFWVGTLPALIALGVGVQALAGGLRRYVPVLTSVLVIVVGLATLAGRLGVSREAMLALAQPRTTAQAQDGVLPSGLDPLNLPCCTSGRDGLQGVPAALGFTPSARPEQAP